MSKKHKKRLSSGWIIFLIIMGLIDLALLIALLLRGNNVALINVKGMIAQEQLNLMIYSAGILLAIGIPSVFLLYFTAWKYRESNVKSKYDPDMRHGKWFNIFVWGVPTVFMLILAAAMWPATQRLAPQKSIAADVKPLTVQVVALRWKWLFIYPEQNIATVNYLQIPVATPVVFELTADEAPMSSFWIPNLGGQLYAMTGHINRLNLLAEESGDYPGRSAEINGKGFAGMKFKARVTSRQSFDQWAKDTRQYAAPLDAVEYQKLIGPSENNAVVFYAPVQSDLYDKLLMKYMGPQKSMTENHGGGGEQ